MRPMRLRLSAPSDRAARSFVGLWLATATGTLGLSILDLLLPLIVARDNLSPLLVAGVTSALNLPWLIFGLPAGVLLDRVDRLRVLRGVYILGLLAALGILLADQRGQWLLVSAYLAALLAGVAATLKEPATFTLVPHLVPAARLDLANARLFIALQIVESTAFPIAGALALLGIATAAGGAAATCALAVLCLLPVRRLSRGPEARPTTAMHPHWRSELVSGLRFIRQHPTLRTITGMAAVINASWTGWMAVFLLYALDPGPMRLSTVTYGVLIAAGGVGGLLGAALALRVQHRFGRRASIGINVVGNGLAFLSPVLTANPWIIGAAVGIGGIGGPMWGLTTVSLQQRAVPDALRGRVASAYRMVSLGAQALGPLITGSVAQLLGLRAAFALAAAATFLTLIPWLRGLHERDLEGTHATAAAG